MKRRNIKSTLLIEEFEKWLVENNKSKKTIVSYLDVIKHMVKVTSIVSIECITGEVLNRYLEKCIHTFSNSINTINLKIYALDKYLIFLSDNHLINLKKIKMMKPLKKDNSQKSTSNISRDIILQLSDLIIQESNPLHELLFELLLILSPREIINLKTNDLILAKDNNSININIKNSIKLISSNQNFLKAYNNWMQIRIYKQTDHNYLLISERKTPINYQTLRYIIMKYHRMIDIESKYNLSSYKFYRQYAKFHITQKRTS